MKYKVGDKVKLRSKEGLDELKRQVGDLYIHPEAYKNAGSEQTILECNEGFYRYDASSMFWHESLFEGLVEEEVDLIPKFGEFSDNEPLDIPTMTTEFVKEHGLPCPNGYTFKDENGNVINATKIVLEKKKKEYPKTYEECCEILDVSTLLGFTGMTDGEVDLYGAFISLIRCRDAYWRIAGAEMGLGKPWEPDYTEKTVKYCLRTNYGRIVQTRTSHDNHPFSFPTEEMRDAFYENFKELIEICKELL